MTEEKKRVAREWHLFRDSAFGPEINDELGVILVEKAVYQQALEQISRLEKALEFGAIESVSNRERVFELNKAIAELKKWRGENG